MTIEMARQTWPRAEGHGSVRRASTTLFFPVLPVKSDLMKLPLSHPEIVVGLDLGTTKVSAVVGEVDIDGITVLGVGNVPCRGLRKGVVANIEYTVRSIREASHRPYEGCVAAPFSQNQLRRSH